MSNFIIAIVAIIVVINLFMLISKRKDRSKNIRKSNIETAEELAIRQEEMKRKLRREQDEAAQFVLKRNKTLEMYSQFSLRPKK